MSTATISSRKKARVRVDTLADLLSRLGDIPLERILMHPAPGTATEDDVLAETEGDDKRLCELVDGTLVEKAMGFYEARMAAVLIQIIGNFLDKHDLGIVTGADATMRLCPGLVRIPDVSFLSWRHFPKRRMPRKPIPDLVPDLAVEVLSRSNTKKEMARKRKELFAGGARIVWEADPDTRTVAVYTGPERHTILDEEGVLDGGRVLPGFRLSVREWFERSGQPDNE